MAHVVVNGIVYVPRAEIPPATDDRIEEAVKQLVVMLYLREQHKALANAWDVLNVLSPDLAELVSQDAKAAYDRMYPEEHET